MKLRELVDSSPNAKDVVRSVIQENICLKSTLKEYKKTVEQKPNSFLARQKDFIASQVIMLTVLLLAFAFVYYGPIATIGARE